MHSYFYSFFLLKKKRRFSKSAKFSFSLDLSILVNYLLCLTQFQNRKTNTLMNIKNLHLGSLAGFTVTWSNNAMWSFLMHSLLIHSKRGLVVIRQASSIFLSSKSIRIEFGFYGLQNRFSTSYVSSARINFVNFLWI